MNASVQNVIERKKKKNIIVKIEYIFFVALRILSNRGWDETQNSESNIILFL